MKLSSISLHPKLGAAFDAFVSLGLLLWLPVVGHTASLIVWGLTRLIAWLLLVAAVYYPPGFSRLRHFLTLGLFWCGVTTALIFIDRQALWYLVAISVLVLPAVSFALIPSAQAALSFIIKPWRRWRLTMVVFGLMGIFSGLFAASVFQVVPPLTWWVPLLSGLFSALIAEWWWREYAVPPRTERLSLLVFALVFAELTAIVGFWPLGYFASGLLIVWLWYVSWLMMRFHLSTEGVNWKKQTPFLIINATLLIIFLFILRWR